MDTNKQFVNKNNTQQAINEGVVGTHTTTYYKKVLKKILHNEKYCDILYLAFNKGFTYLKECNAVIICDSRHYLNYLVGKDLFQDYKPTSQEIDLLCKTQNLHSRNLLMLQCYSLNPKVRAILENPLWYELMVEECSNNALNRKNMLLQKYNEIVSQEEEKYILRIQRAKNKLPQYRTAEDWALLQLERSNK